MNARQKMATVAALVLLCITVVFAPWQRVSSAGHVLPGVEYGFILTPPVASGRAVRLHTTPLLVSWGAILLLYGGVILLCRKTA